MKISKIKILFNELFRPALKCKRIGKHQWAYRKVVVAKRAYNTDVLFSDRFVIVDFDAEMGHCKVCGKPNGPVGLVEKRCFTSVTRPTSMWDQLDKDGYLIR